MIPSAHTQTHRKEEARVVVCISNPTCATLPAARGGGRAQPSKAVFSRLFHPGSNHTVHTTLGAPMTLSFGRKDRPGDIII